MTADHAPEKWHWRGLGLILVLLFALAAGVFLLLPEFDVGSREAARRAVCVHNLRMIGLALNNYHEKYHCFPPAYIADTDGKPMHSWRVLLLPFFEEDGWTELYKQYDFNEPWDGPRNRQLAQRIFPVFRCLSDTSKAAQTSYVAVVGDETMWPEAKTLSIRKITDGISTTIAVVEVADSGIGWSEPRDLTFDDAILGINRIPAKPAGGATQHVVQQISSHHSGGANFLFADGSIHFLTDRIPANTLRALLTANGGEDVTIPDD